MKPCQKSRALNRTQTRLELRGLRPNTVTTYLRGARQFLEAVDKTPGRVTRGDVEQYLLGLRTGGRSVSTRNVALASIRFLLQSTTRRDVSSAIPHCKQPRTLVTVLSGAELERRVLEALRTYYRACRPAGPELFPGHRGRRPGTVLSRNAVSKALKRVVKIAGIDKPVTPYTFRHCFATHLLDTGADVRTVQVLLGHARIESTAGYLHLSRARLARVPSPLDLIGTPRGRVLG